MNYFFYLLLMHKDMVKMRSTMNKKPKNAGHIA